jgi:Kef-type K+ transport system membrane component KefB
MTPVDLSIRFFLQLAILLAACRLVGLLARRIGQPQVIAEMVTGILLGPSVLGALEPAFQSHVFPPESRPIIYSVSQVGIALYMFMVGLEFQNDLLRDHIRRATAVSLTGIAVPFALGGLLALSLVGRPEFFAPSIGGAQAVLFLGAAMAITAFPVLARIIQAHGLTGTRLGTLVLTAGSLDDAAAWCLLAVVLATTRGEPSAAWLTVGGGVLYAIVVITAGRRALAVMGRTADRDGRLGEAAFVGVLALVMFAAWITDRIGIHAVFGTFVLGAAMPRGVLARDVLQRIGPLTVGLLVPLFFVYSGLNTRLGLLDSTYMWTIAALALVIACVGKLAACAVAARLSGETWRESLAIGTLMNARGLMELILLNIGLERGIINPALFTIMAMMAVVTTLAASPLFGLVSRASPLPHSRRSEVPARS